MNERWRAPAGLHTTAARLPAEGNLAGFDGATGWINSPPLDPAGLRGRVVLVSFWTYTCINWLRQLPYLRAWADKYAGHGLTVVGVHTPEFPVRARRRPGPAGRNRDEDRLPGRDRQRRRDLAGVRQSLLARALLRRRGRADPAPLLRRG